MSDYGLQQQLVELRILLQNICDGFDTDNLNKKSVLTMRTKVLYVIGNNTPCSPGVLIDTLGIAKGNLALLCKSLCEDKVIDSVKSDKDRRNVYYKLTAKGEAELNVFFASMTDSAEQLTEREMRTMEKKVRDIIDFLHKKYNK